MDHTAELFLGLLVAVAALSTVARLINVPYPILLVVGGLAIGFVPGVPEVQLDPDLVLVLILPPLLYVAAFFASLPDLRADLRAISMLSIGLVIATTATVALVAHLVIDGMTWGAAFALGAIVAPTDPLAAAAIARRQGAPRRVITIVEGESLINDGTALVLYRAAVAAVVGGSSSILDSIGTRSSRRGWPPPRRGSPGSRSWRTRAGPATRRSSGCGGCWGTASGASRPSAKAQVTTRSRARALPTSGLPARSWRLSARRSSSSATRRSQTR